jgi:uncharacterized protein YegL
MKNLFFTNCLTTICLTTSLVLTSQQLVAQGGTSSGSVGAARAGFHRISETGTYLMPKADFFRVEEFINYHRHNLPLPTKGQRVHLDVQNIELENGKVVYQFGITTPRALDSKKLPPLNLVLVIDESGSMGGEKIANLKSALHTFVERFRENDRITVVGFEQEARVILEAEEKTNVNRISKAIDNIHAAGSTNLHAGLMCGYEMALKHFDPERTNRMIFLTDGNANVGVTESNEIARESKRCVKRGISLVTIGLGVDMNNGLLREIADSGRGLMHYVGDAKDIKKTFIDEIDSVLAPAASKVQLKLGFKRKMKSPKVFGYKNACEFEKTIDGYELVLKLDDLNHGATQVVMVRFPEFSGKQISGQAKLTYTDAISGKACMTNRNLREIEKRDDGHFSVKRNYAIALVANSIQAAAKESNEGDNRKADSKLKKGVEKANEILHDRYDKNLKRVVKIANEYREHLDQSHKLVENENYPHRRKFK